MLSWRPPRPRAVQTTWSAVATISTGTRGQAPRQSDNSRQSSKPNGTSMYDKLFAAAPPTRRRHARHRDQHVASQDTARSAIEPASSGWARDGAPLSGPRKDGTQDRMSSAVIKEMKAFDWQEQIPLEREDAEKPPVRWGDKFLKERAMASGSLEKQLASEELDASAVAAKIHDPKFHGPTVLVLNSASKSLLPTDFYRLAQQGQNLDGWTAGIVKVEQSRDPITREPLGHYQILFDSRAAALAYREELMRRLALAQRAVPLTSSRAPRDTADRQPLAGGLGDLEADVRGFTLLPPSANLDLRLLPASAADEEEEGERRPSRVLLRLEGSALGAAALRAAIAADGRERNLAWRVGKAGDAVVPIVEGSRNAGAAELHDGMRFERFLVTFEDAVEARRFVRSWHKREVSDVGRDRTMVINACALW